MSAPWKLTPDKVSPETMGRIEGMIRTIVCSMPHDAVIWQNPLDLTPQSARRWGKYEILAEVCERFGSEVADAASRLPILTRY
jgi:hypothetical protein